MVCEGERGKVEKKCEWKKWQSFVE
jgi:hypothetical protein